MKITGSTALVTGASKRIGRAIALSLAEEGCNVAVHYLGSHDEAIETCEAIRSLGVASESIRADLAKPTDCDRLWIETIDKLGASPNILINNASPFARADLARTSVSEFDNAIAVNVRAPMLLAQMMAQRMSENQIGKIVNINDIRSVYKSRFAYGVSNAALSGMTESLSVSLAPQIQVNELRLGPILPLSDEDTSDEDQSMQPSMAEQSLGPAQRMGSLTEVCRAVISLIENDYINGASLAVDGGLSVLNR